jgi:hypothetical protein
MGEKNKHRNELVGLPLRETWQTRRLPRTAITSLYQYEKGDRRLTIFHASAAAQLLHVASPWLVTGEESPRTKRPPHYDTAYWMPRV